MNRMHSMPTQALIALEERESKGGKQGEQVLTAYMVFVDWAKTNKLRPVATEWFAYNRAQRYAGTPDFLAWLGEDLVMADLKTSKALYGDEVMQVAAHGASLASMTLEELSAGPGARFEGQNFGGRHYRIPPPDEAVVPSVTNIIGASADKAGLVYWAADQERAAWEEIVVEALKAHPLRISEWTRDALMRRFGAYKNGKPRRAFEAAKEVAADTGTRAHKLCELWLRSQIKEDGGLQNAILEARGKEPDGNWMPRGLIIRLPKDLEKETEPEIRSYPVEEMTAAYRDGFLSARHLFAWRNDRG